MIPDIWPCTYWGAIFPDLAGLSDELQKDGICLSDFLWSRRLEVHYDVRGRRAMIQASGGEWQVCSDGELANIHGQLVQSPDHQPQKSGIGRPPSWTEDRWRRAWRAYIATVRVDPFAEWLSTLPLWDSNPRVDFLLERVLGAQPNDLTTWASRYLFLGPIQRARFPGSKLDQIPVLVGAQGTGKSAFVRGLLPPDRPEWHGDDIRVGMDGKQIAEATAGRVLIEFSELILHKWELAEQVKAMLTRQDDGQCRMAYAIQPESIPRRWCGVATANDPGTGILPDDPTGHRRFVVVPVLGADEPVEPLLEQDREQLWAEAVHRWAAGEFKAGAGLPRRLLPEAQKVARDYERTDEVLDEMIRELPASFVSYAKAGDGVSLKEICTKLGLASDGLINRGTQMGVASALTRAGWSKHRPFINGRQPRMWRSPAPAAEPEEEAAEEF